MVVFNCNISFVNNIINFGKMYLASLTNSSGAQTILFSLMLSIAEANEW